ncbi:putative armadillo-like helical, nucleotide exchange factor Fes1 [Helianthus annuus]|nr:putative armadillo-like helical, nucleotide exchange factor Fes1 [Helianthus annuus]KAJ0460933.1 putative armadillo-like helical, nucleotide exchange factor Fes1 [Helianthus annuus]KAJ0641364.1 putative armadillo-like helical, nucleotide exchange factor Fes1 [Helianthus annuus]KAJ0645261.1 putative armadillo-like helical, nucleotide exchange factor Fes1 [Helianthus annuus]
MGRRLLTFAFALVVAVTALRSSTAEPVNNSASGGLLWSSANGAGLVGNTETDESLNDHDELDGGFPSLDGMLQWAIGHSDPAKLELKAHDVQKLSADELQQRQMELKELVEKLEVPSDAKLMKIAIDDLNNSSLSLEDHHRALEELLVLVEAIDNANDLHKMGGLSVVIRELTNSDSGIRTTCAWIIGKASQNNPVVQEQVLELGALPTLITMVKSRFTEEAIKALYAVSSVIRNNRNGIDLFYSEGGDIMVQGVLSNATADVRLHRRSVSLVGDLAEHQLEYSSKPEPPFFSSCALVRPVLDLTTSDDLDLQEKVLVAVKNLLKLKSAEALVVDGFCGLKGALERMRHQLQQEEDRREYANDVEGLCKEVNLIYLEKRNKVSQVPT